MKWQRPLVIAGAIALGAGAWRAGGWHGIALVASGVVLWVMINVTRMITIMKRAADRPKGYVGSAVMLNAKLQAGQQMLTVLALTRSLGERLTEPDADPETYRWSDPGHSSVTAQFRNGRLTQWQLERPTPEDTSGLIAAQTSHLPAKSEGERQDTGSPT